MSGLGKIEEILKENQEVLEYGVVKVRAELTIDEACSGKVEGVIWLDREPREGDIMSAFQDGEQIVASPIFIGPVAPHEGGYFRCFFSAMSLNFLGMNPGAVKLKVTGNINPVNIT